MISIKHRGSFKKTEKFLKKAARLDYLPVLEKYGQKGVEALSAATPVDTGLTAASWYYEVVRTKNGASIRFLNSNVVNYVSIAIILQYGHATRNGGWVEGRDYINPAIRPIFDELASGVWKEVINL